MTDNLTLWKAVSKTDPAAVKPITGKSYKGNSPKPYWLIERATEAFGPVGIGWGCTVKSERFERLSETDVLHVAVVSVWYVHDGKRSETFDQMGGTKAAYKTSSGSLLVDEDAGKKSVTDGMVKCLSMIGFAGDIFSGRWDDSKYVAEVREEFAEKRREEASTPESVAAYLEISLTKIKGIKQRQELIDWWNGQQGMRDELGIVAGDANYQKLFDAYKARGTAISVGGAKLINPNSEAA